jgi:hypothetical protein
MSLTSAATNEDGPLPTPAGDAVPPKQFRQRQFSLLVPAPANAPHDLQQSGVFDAQIAFAFA